MARGKQPASGFSDNCRTYESEADIKRRRGLSEYFNQKRKFICKDPSLAKQLLAASSYGKRDLDSSLYSNAYPAAAMSKSITVQQKHPDSQMHSDAYGNHGNDSAGASDACAQGKHGQFTNLKKLTSYFSEKDLQPKFTESVLCKHRQSNRKLDDADDELLEMIDHPTARSNARSNADNAGNADSNHCHGEPAHSSPVAENAGQNACDDEQLDNDQKAAAELRNAKLADLLSEGYADDMRRHNSSYQCRQKYERIDTELHWSRMNKPLPLDENREPIISQHALDRDQFDADDAKQRQAHKIEQTKLQREQRQRQIEEQQDRAAALVANSLAVRVRDRSVLLMRAVVWFSLCCRRECEHAVDQ